MKIKLKLLQRMKALTYFGLTLTVATSCGALGEKKAATSSMSQSDTACLDELGPLSKDFLDGNVSEAKWRSTWNCVDDTIGLFGKYVQGSDANGYSITDMRFLMQKFLFSKSPVTNALVESALAVKASLFGGAATRISKSELADFQKLTRFLRDETSALIPHLRNRKVNPTPETLRDFANAVDAFGSHFADYLKTESNPELTLEMGLQFMTELSAISIKSDPVKISQYTRLFQELKILLVKGEADGIGGADWTKLMKIGFRAGGAFFAYTDLATDDPAFQIEMVERIRGVLDSSLAEWNGLFPYTQVDRIIDHIPSDLLPGLPENVRAGLKSTLRPRTLVKDGKTTTFRPAFSRLAQSNSDIGIDSFAIDRLFDAFKTGLRATDHLKKIFKDTQEEISPTLFEVRARAYLSSLDAAGQSDVNRLIVLSKRYLGYFPGDSKEMFFAGLDRHSQNNLSRMSWYEIASGLLLQGYGSSSNAYGKAGTVDDVNTLIDDLNPILYGLHMLHPAKTEIGAKRFREANLFTSSGNGDDLMDLPETTVYISFLFTATQQSSRIQDLAFGGTNPCPLVGWNVPLKLPAYEIGCFRERLRTNFNEIFKNMPRLQDDYAVMTPSEKDMFHETLEKAAKGTGFDPSPMTEYDVGSYGGIAHFVESAMQKFDRNGDNTLDRAEALEVVFPVFKRELATMSKIKIDFVNKAVLLYLMQYGREPKIKDLLSWAISFQFLKKFNARRIRIYQVFATLSPPSAPDLISPTEPSNSSEPGRSALSFIGDSLMKGLMPYEAEGTLASSANSHFDLSKVDPAQLRGYPAAGPIIDPTSKYQEALEVLPQDL
ncbi:MAG: hypothetical protein H7301_13625 [Cryobacterium sp.]|nr:hypothetical protein [Oligoflexia bacterium]